VTKTISIGGFYAQRWPEVSGGEDGPEAVK
jgi:hypothetical protein